MSVDANIAFVHSKLGLIPGWGGGQRLYRIVGYAHALEILATARIIESEEAQRIGLVNRVILKEELDETAMGLSKQISSNSTESIKTIKRLFLQSSANAADEARKAEREAFIDLWDRDSRRKIFEKLKGKTK
jgi:enoyl-CoA hydratase/carnithine racemase